MFEGRAETGIVEDAYTIVVPAYNEQEYLPHALASLRAAMAGLPALRGRLLVVDNASTDATGEVARASWEAYGEVAVCDSDARRPDR